MVANTWRSNFLSRLIILFKHDRVSFIKSLLVISCSSLLNTGFYIPSPKSPPFWTSYVDPDTSHTLPVFQSGLCNLPIMWDTYFLSRDKKLFFQKIIKNIVLNQQIYNLPTPTWKKIMLHVIRITTARFGVENIFARCSSLRDLLIKEG